MSAPVCACRLPLSPFLSLWTPVMGVKSRCNWLPLEEQLSGRSLPVGQGLWLAPEVQVLAEMSVVFMVDVGSKSKEEKDPLASLF